MRILLIEDDTVTADFVTTGLNQAGYRVEHAADGLTGLCKAKTEPFDAAIIDIMLPKLDGLSVIREMRAAHLTLPVIVLSARGTVDNKIEGLEAGSDDYLAKPFSLAELIARLQALLRRASGQNEAATELTVADLVLNPITHRVFRNGLRIELQPLEYQLLEYLMRNKGRVVTKSTIMEHVWEYTFTPQTNVVECRVSHLRDKIDKPFEKKLLKTVRGFGYVLEDA